LYTKIWYLFCETFKYVILLTMLFRILKHWSKKKRQRETEFIMQRFDEKSVSQNGATWTVKGLGTINI